MEVTILTWGMAIAGVLLIGLSAPPLTRPHPMERSRNKGPFGTTRQATQLSVPRAGFSSDSLGPSCFRTVSDHRPPSKPQHHHLK